MIRVFDFRMAGSDEVIKLASMSEGMAKRYVSKSREMLKDVASIPVDDWITRRDTTIRDALSRAGTEMTQAELEDKFDIETLDEMLLFILEKSKLRTPAEGGAKADSISENSSAA